jgi:hypothetical protein
MTERQMAGGVKIVVSGIAMVERCRYCPTGIEQLSVDRTLV